MDTPSLTRRALLVTLKYEWLPEPQQLPGTQRDLEIMRKVTKEQFNFNDVKEVLGEDATKQNILNSLNDLSSRAQQGDVVLFYFSGHGAYLPSTKDEGLLPAQIIGHDQSELTAEEICITGRDLLPFFEQLAEKNVKVTVICDCCHSGQLYRVTEWNNSGCTDIIPKQIIIERGLDSESPSGGTGNKLIRGGWTPKENDTFFYIAACSSVQLAGEKHGEGGKLTMAMESVFKSIESFQEPVSNHAFFRLVAREFKNKGWYESQTPQLEGENLDTELFGDKIIKVPFKSGISVNKVDGGEVILSAGCLQNLQPGVYDVFETTVLEDGVNLGERSPYWLGSIDVTEGNIGRVESSASIMEPKPDKEISAGCLAYLKTPSNIKSNALVKLDPDSFPEKNAQDLVDYIKKTKILNVSTQPMKIEDKDLITIEVEDMPSGQDEKKYWVARQRGDVIVPPLSLGREETMAENLYRHLRFQFALASAHPPKSQEELLENVSVKVVKIEKVKPFTNASKEQRIKEGLKDGKDLYEDVSQRPYLRAHSLTDPKEKNRLKDDSGDAFVYQVTNQNVDKQDTVHICVLFYQFDGAIKAIYPPKKGCTAELRGGDTAEDIFRVFIPHNSLRKMAQPDLTKPEPDKGKDRIVVYASSKPANFDVLQQPAIDTEPDLITRGKKKAEPLSGLAEFAAKVRCVEDHVPDLKWFVEKKEFEVVKNTE